MKLAGPVGKITSNLYFYASMNGVLDAVEKDFKLIEKDLIGTKEWLNSNGWTTTQKLELVNKFVAKAGSLSSFTKELLPYFVEQKILKHLPEIKDLFFKLVKEKRGEIDVFVTSADPLDAATLKQLEGLIIKQIGSSAASKVREGGEGWMDMLMRGRNTSQWLIHITHERNITHPPFLPPSFPSSPTVGQLPDGRGQGPGGGPAHSLQEHFDR
jgi:F0F1-type ATP synthase delta subunit